MATSRPDAAHMIARALAVSDVTNPMQRLVPPPAAPATAVQLEPLQAELQQLVARYPTVGWGGEGPIAAVEEYVEWQTLLPNPLHPREDWAVVDDDLKSLMASLKSAFGQVAAIRVTPLAPDDARVEEGYRFQIVKGHRIYAAAKLGDINPVRVRVFQNANGQPLDIYQQLMSWLILTETPKRLRADQVIVAFARIRHAFDQLVAQQGRQLTFPTYRELAPRLGVSLGALSLAAKISDEPPVIVEAVARKQLQAQAASLLIEKVPDPTTRADLVHRVLVWNDERQRSGKQPLTVQQILGLAQSKPPEPRPGVPAEMPRQRPLQLRSLKTVRAGNRTVDETLAALLLDVLDLMEERGEHAPALPPAIQQVMEALARPKTREALAALYGA